MAPRTLSMAYPPNMNVPVKTIPSSTSNVEWLKLVKKTATPEQMERLKAILANPKDLTPWVTAVEKYLNHVYGLKMARTVLETFTVPETMGQELVQAIIDWHYYCWIDKTGYNYPLEDSVWVKDFLEDVTSEDWVPRHHDRRDRFISDCFWACRFVDETTFQVSVRNFQNNAVAKMTPLDVARMIRQRALWDSKEPVAIDIDMDDTLEVVVTRYFKKTSADPDLFMLIKRSRVQLGDMEDVVRKYLFYRYPNHSLATFRKTQKLLAIPKASHVEISLVWFTYLLKALDAGKIHTQLANLVTHHRDLLLQKGLITLGSNSLTELLTRDKGEEKDVVKIKIEPGLETMPSREMTTGLQKGRMTIEVIDVPDKYVIKTVPIPGYDGPWVKATKPV